MPGEEDWHGKGNGRALGPEREQKATFFFFLVGREREGRPPRKQPEMG